MMQLLAVALLSIAAIAISTPGASAQTTPPPIEIPRTDTRVQGGFGFLVGLTAGEFRRVGPTGAFGLIGYADVGVGESIFSLGGEATFMQYGKQTRRIVFGPVVPELPDPTLDIVTQNEMITLHARVRAQRRKGGWRPYVDGLYGLTYIYTQTRSEGQYEFEAQIQAQDFVGSQGIGGGVMMRAGSGQMAPRLDVGARYIRGGSASYLTEGAIRQVGNEVIRDVTRSRTDLITVYVGLAFGR